MKEIRAYDMSEHQRIFHVEGGSIKGLFSVLLPCEGDSKIWIKALDFTIWHNPHFGRVLYSNDLTATVENGVVDLAKHMIKSDLLADVEEVWDEMIETLRVIADAVERAAK